MERLRLAADLHVHSCLSPCGDNGMTPNNLVNMAYIKGLDALAVCDHNSALNLRACKAVADARGLVFIPGIEVETREEVHMLCLFPKLDAAEDFGAWVYQYLPPLPNRPDLFGEQIVMDEDDRQVAVEPRLLIQSTELSIEDAADACRRAGGVPAPAHINRTSNSLLCSLGFIPPHLSFTCVEVYERLPVEGVDLEKYHVLYNSDAHYLEDISERRSFISAFDRTPEGVIKWLSAKRSVT